MADIILVQKSDLDPKSFKNNNSNGKGGISVAVSPDNGNLIGLRNNGLYYGIEAPADTRSLHVHPNGDDAAAGTRAAPLRTIGEAIRRNQAGQRYTIHIYEGDGEAAVHEWRSSFPSATGHLMTIQPYGARFTAAQQQNPAGSIEYLRSEQVLRPVINFISDKRTSTGHENPAVYGNSPTQDAVRFNAVNLNFDADTPDNPIQGGGLFEQFFGGRDAALVMEFIGCVINSPRANYYAAVTGRTSSFLFDACMIHNAPEHRLLRIMAGTVSLQVRSAGRVAGTPSQGNTQTGTPTTLTTMATNALGEWGQAFTGVTGVVQGNVVAPAGMF